MTLALGTFPDFEEPKTQAFNPAARSYEAFRLGEVSTHLLDPLEATSHSEALGEATCRWAWDRGDRLGLREIGREVDRLFIYAVRKKATGVRRDFTSPLEHQRWLEHICCVDLNAVAGISVGLVGFEHELHLRRQHQRPEGARLERDAL
jgi:hypothetical protein